MNPDSTCYFYDEILRVKYAAYPNVEKKNSVHTTMIESLNVKLKNTYNDKRFKKKICSMNRDLRKYCDMSTHCQATAQ
jgi:HD superfamily phosphohydrolase YqeK